MNADQGSKILQNAIKGFHGRFKKIYGQIALRLDDATYIMTGGIKQLSGLTEDSFLICDIRTGDLGEIFRRCPDINAFIFGCSEDMVAVSKRDGDVPVCLEDLAQLTGARLRILPNVSPGLVVSLFRETTVALIRGSGAIAAGSNMKKAVAGIHIVEKACEAEIHGPMIGGTVAIDQDLAESYKRDFRLEYVYLNDENNVEYSFAYNNEYELRSQLIDYGRQLVKRDLSYGSWGNLSVRLNSHEMLITPSSMDYFDIKMEDIVRVDINTLQYERTQRIPSRERAIHAMAYRMHPDCGAIIHTHSNGISVFAACEAGFKLKDTPLSNVIGNVQVTRSARAATPELATAVADAFRSTHAAIIPHHGAVFYGPSLDVVFAIAEAVEVRARKLLGFEMYE